MVLVAKKLRICWQRVSPGGRGGEGGGEGGHAWRWKPSSCVLAGRG
jgi:hypothetical protein